MKLKKRLRTLESQYLRAYRRRQPIWRAMKRSDEVMDKLYHAINQTERQIQSRKRKQRVRV